MFVIIIAGIAILGIIIFMAMHFSFRKTFLYIFASVGLVLTIIGLVSLINLGLRAYVFTKADYPCYNSRPMLMEGDKATGMTQAQLDEQAKVDEKNCMEQRVSDKQRSASNAIAMLIVGVPLFMYNWNIIRRDKEI